MNWDQVSADVLGVAEEVIVRLHGPIVALADELAGRLRDGRKLLLCGNGGSAADAQHIAAELVNRFQKNRRPYAALALTTDASIITSIGNDFGYEQIFEKQVQALGQEGDVLLALSTSGQSPSVCRAVEAARARGMLTVALTGGRGGALRGLCDRCLCLESTSVTARIQEGHMLIYHLLCERIEDVLQ